MVDGLTSFPFLSYPKAWSPGTDTLKPNAGTAYTGEVVYFNATKAEDLEKYKGKLKGKIVLIGAMREVKPWMDGRPASVITTRSCWIWRMLRTRRHRGRRVQRPRPGGILGRGQISVPSDRVFLLTKAQLFGST